MTNRGPNDNKKQAEAEKVEVEEILLPQTFESFTSDILKIVEENEETQTQEEQE